MLTPKKIVIYLYAETDEQVKDAQNAAYEFVTTMYNSGIAVTATKFAEAIRRFKNNYFVKKFLQ